MARSTSYIWLNTWARKLIKQKGIRRYRAKNTICDPFSPEDIPLFKYRLPDGEYVFEEEQCALWASGPVIFVCLKDKDGKKIKKSVWKNKEINEYL